MAFQYRSQRDEMLSFLPADVRTVLDIGCGTGTFGASLRALQGGLETWAVEVDGQAAAAAAANYDHVLHAAFPDATLPVGTFDAIFCNDVLEHMADPADALPAMADLLAPNGRLIASIPNVRHVMVTWPLVIRGDWTYTDEGLLDRTHLRFFTCESAKRLFTDNGWHAESVTGINRRLRLGERDRTSLKALSWLTRGRADPFFFLQYVIVARPLSTS